MYAFIVAEALITTDFAPSESLCCTVTDAGDGVAGKPVMWLDDAKGEFIVTSDGDMLSGEYAIDADRNVYEYDYELDALVKVPALAYNSEAMLLNYDADSQLCVNELIATGDFLMPV